MVEDDLYYYLGFSHCYGIGPMKLASLLKYFGCAEKAYKATKQDLIKIIGQNLGEKFVVFRNRFDPLKKLEELRKKEIAVIPIYSPLYPKALKEISDPPICLYIKGDAELLTNSVTPFFQESSISDQSSRFCHSRSLLSCEALRSPSATQSASRRDHLARDTYLLFFAIVGTRTPTPYGQQIARKFASELAEAGFIIVSGMALGIDSISHWAALDAGKKTVAVLGCGVDIIYPAVNRRLYNEIIDKQGLVISEFPPGQTVLKGLFIARNRIISGLSKGILVIEGASDSGALITARYAANQGKDVFATPAPITSPMSQAPNLLLKQGAKLVTSVEDIYEELGIKITPVKKDNIERLLSDRERHIFHLLQEEPMLVDDISIEINLEVVEILNIISILEIKGVIEKNEEGRYQAKI